jgi:hypothetical protein
LNRRGAEYAKSLGGKEREKNKSGVVLKIGLDTGKAFL